MCNSEVESDKVEREGKPQLEKLRQDVNQTNLEKVRRVKNRLVRINARVSKVREEIQRYLDDDSDMRDLYLTRRLREELRQNTARSNKRKWCNAITSWCEQRRARVRFATAVIAFESVAKNTKPNAKFSEREQRTGSNHRPKRRGLGRR